MPVRVDEHNDFNSIFNVAGQLTGYAVGRVNQNGLPGLVVNQEICVGIKRPNNHPLYLHHEKNITLRSLGTYMEYNPRWKQGGDHC